MSDSQTTKTASPLPWKVVKRDAYEPLAIEDAHDKVVCGWPITEENALLIVEAVNAR